MSTQYPKSPNEKTRNGMVYFPRMLDKIRLHARGELAAEYHKNLGAPMTADGACCNFLRVNYADLRERVLQGGSEDEILEWCGEKGRALNGGDIGVGNGFASKLGWRDFMTPRFQKLKEAQGVADRHDIACVPDLMDFEEGRKS